MESALIPSAICPIKGSLNILWRERTFHFSKVFNSQAGYQSWWSLLWRLWVSWDHQGGSRDPLVMAVKLADEGPHLVISLTSSWCKNAPVASELTWTQMQTRNLYEWSVALCSKGITLLSHPQGFQRRAIPSPLLSSCPTPYSSL